MIGIEACGKRMRRLRTETSTRKLPGTAWAPCHPRGMRDGSPAPGFDIMEPDTMKPDDSSIVRCYPNASWAMLGVRTRRHRRNAFEEIMMTTPRLSALQRRIITEIANHTVNTSNCDEYWEHGWHETNMTWKALLLACYSHWDTETPPERLLSYRPKVMTAKASFSRAIKSLVFAKGLLNGIALGWVGIEGRCVDVLAFQGGGRKGESSNGQTTPRLKFVGLTDNGWRVAHELLGTDVGQCRHARRH